MYCFLPVVRFHNELEEGHTSSYTDEGPVAWNKQGPGHEPVLFSLHASQQVEIHVKEVAKNEAAGAHIEDGTWEQNMIDCNHRRAKGNVDGQHCPHQGVDEQY